MEICLEVKAPLEKTTSVFCLSCRGVTGAVYLLILILLMLPLIGLGLTPIFYPLFYPLLSMFFAGEALPSEPFLLETFEENVGSR